MPYPLNYWLGQMQTASLHNYCRRHQAVLDAYPRASCLHHEDLALNPQAGLKQVCNRLYLDCNHSALGIYQHLDI